jgi:hypothetical protein
MARGAGGVKGLEGSVRGGGGRGCLRGRPQGLVDAASENSPSLHPGAES